MLLDTLSQNATSAATVSHGNSVAHFLTVLVLFVLVLAATYFTTKFVAKTQEGKARTGNLEVLETIAIAPGRFLQIVRIGRKYIAIGVGKDHISFLTELSEEEFSHSKENGSVGFAGILQRMKDKFPTDESDAENSLGNFRDNASGDNGGNAAETEVKENREDKIDA